MNFSFFLDMEAGSFLDIIQLQEKKRKNMMKRSYAEQWELGMSIIAILALTMSLFENILPAFFIYIALGIILVDVVVIIILETHYAESNNFQFVELRNRSL